MRPLTASTPKVGMRGRRFLIALWVALMAVACSDSGSSQFSTSVVDIGGGNGEASRSDGVPPPVTAKDGVADPDGLLRAAQRAVLEAINLDTHTNSHHYIHLEQPQLVGDAIREVVDAVPYARP